ncbi:MAG TPA: NAD(P)H-hydrate dehydratase [Gemmatimonadaceae bacterium]|nr:NAD(P)H-hydrate dehydratase [Gemmatimonadaceae bacterium]
MAALSPVLRADEAAAADVATIVRGVPSRALMQRAGAAAAAEIARRHGARLPHGVLLLAGGGNNGGDAWVVARALAAVGVHCRVHEAVAARTDDARAERELALPLVECGAPGDGAGVVVDGLLGTGASGRPRGAVAEAIAHAARLRAGGAPVVALDVPSGVDATTGEADGALTADLTLTFGAMKRGLLVARAHAGRIALLDIGLVESLDGESEPPRLVDARWVHHRLPRIAADAHKGTRRKLVIVGGDRGMAGAAVLAARAAAASGVGMVRCLVAPDSLPVVQGAAPEALGGPWPATDAEVDAQLGDWADAVLIGPGLGRGDAAGALLERVLARWRGPVVLDADALNHFAGRADALGALLRGRPALLTPHVAEFGRLAELEPRDVLASRFDVGLELARRTEATVLLKGVPTVLAAPDGRRLVTASGTPVLAAAGSGDLLSGIAGTLVAQMDDVLHAAACAAWAHGRAAELAGDGAVRGITLRDVHRSLARVWRERPTPPVYPVLAELPAVP